MTSVAEAGGAARWRGRLVWVALVLSLTLNVCFVGGLIWSKVTLDEARLPAERFRVFSQDLSLTHDQIAAFRVFGHTVRDRTRLLHRSNNPLLKRVWQEMARPTPDQALITHLVDEASANRQAYQKDTAAALETFMTTLSPEQRSRLADFAENRRDKLSRHMWWLISP